MGNGRRFTATSDDKNDAPRSGKEEVTITLKGLKIVDEEEEYKKLKIESKAEENEDKKTLDLVENDDDEEEEEDDEVAVVVGEPTRVTGKGTARRNHYNSFKCDGNCYKLEDPVLLVSDEPTKKPYVAIIKDISQKTDGSVMLIVQWFYRPEEAQRRSGEPWESTSTRELFYSFNKDEVPAESVMHKCVVNFTPLHQQIPGRKQPPGFVVQKVYDPDHGKLYDITERNHLVRAQHIE